MCGIFAYLGEKQQLNKLLLYFIKTSHRGPDNCKFVTIKKDLFFGFHRLRINGLYVAKLLVGESGKIALALILPGVKSLLLPETSLPISALLAKSNLNPLLPYVPEYALGVHTP